MGIYRGNVSHRCIRRAPSDVSLRRFFCRRSIRSASGCWDQYARFHTYFPKYGNDDRDVANHRRATAIDQLQRLLCANDYVWTRAREQRLGPPKSSRLGSL